MHMKFLIHLKDIITKMIKFIIGIILGGYIIHINPNIVNDIFMLVGNYCGEGVQELSEMKKD